MERPLSPRIFLFASVAAAAFALAACGGGGGGGGGTIPSTTSTPAATATPTLAPTAAATIVPVSAASPTSVQLGGVSNGSSNEVSSATVVLPAAGVSTTANVSMTAAVPSGVTAPAVRSISRKAAALGIQSTIAYVALQFAADVTVSQAPSFSLTLPFTASGNWYLLFDDPSGAITPQGWTEIAALTIGSNGTTLALSSPPPFAPPITLKAGVKYYFAIGTTGASPIPSPTASATASPTPTASPTATPTASATINPAAIPMGVNAYTTSVPTSVGYVYSCTGTFNGAGDSNNLPWINLTNNTWNSTTKAIVHGSVSWAATASYSATTNGSTYNVATNDEPISPFTTGTFPTQSSDTPAYTYDPNPNSIIAQNLSWALPLTPTVNSTPHCLSGGAIGVTTNGGVFFDALDALGRDAAAHEVTDTCNGHPQGNGQYHYHAISTASGCFTDTKDTNGHSGLVGYALDGFGLYGPDGLGGYALVNANLDICHGHTHTVLFHGTEQNIYHYHVTTEYPYTVGCYRGTPVGVP